MEVKVVDCLSYRILPHNKLVMYNNRTRKTRERRTANRTVNVVIICNAKLSRRNWTKRLRTAMMDVLSAT